MNHSDFLKGWISANDSATQVIAVQVPFIRMLGGNGNDAILLSQILYWNMPSKEGQTKLRVRRDGEVWLAKAHKDWEGETGINEHTARKSIERLKKRGLIETRVMKFAGNPTVHIKIAWEKLEAMLKEAAVESEGNVLTGQNQTSQVDTTKCADRADPLTEITDRDYKTENTFSLTTTERPEKKTGSSKRVKEDASLLEGSIDKESLELLDKAIEWCNAICDDMGIERTKELAIACNGRTEDEVVGAVLALQERLEQNALRRPAQYLASAIKGRYVPPKKWVQYCRWQLSDSAQEYLAMRWAEELVGVSA